MEEILHHLGSINQALQIPTNYSNSLAGLLLSRVCHSSIYRSMSTISVRLELLTTHIHITYVICSSAKQTTGTQSSPTMASVCIGHVPPQTGAVSASEARPPSKPP